MADVLTPKQRSACMRAVRGQDTTPEMLVRRTTHRMGFRYALHKKDLPGSPDLVFPARKKIIFVHGCFWHLHHCKAGQNAPSSNVSYWTAKREKNAARDRRHISALKRQGWRVLVIWECKTKDREGLGDRIAAFLEK